MLISIEGNIGSGKTTILNKLIEHYDIIAEPVHRWISSGWLEKFYQDQHMHAFDFQKYVVSTMYDRIKHIQPDDKEIYITERSIETSDLFADMLMKEGKMTAQENAYIKRLTMALHRPTKKIYIKTDVEQCMKRINKRNRNAESSISEEYLKDLETEHDKYFGNEIMVDGNQSEDKVFEDVLSAVNILLNQK